MSICEFWARVGHFWEVHLTRRFDLGGMELGDGGSRWDSWEDFSLLLLLLSSLAGNCCCCCCSTSRTSHQARPERFCSAGSQWNISEWGQQWFDDPRSKETCKYLISSKGWMWIILQLFKFGEICIFQALHNGMHKGLCFKSYVIALVEKSWTCHCDWYIFF